MDTSRLKKFAQEARRTLMRQVASRLKAVLADGSAARRENPNAVKELEKEIANHGEPQVVERVAYTWFNRFSALRFMDVNGYSRIGTVSPAEGQTRPEILAEAAAGHVDEDIPATIRQQIADLLDGRAPSRDPQSEAYRLLLVAVCNHWHQAMPFMFEKIADFTELLMPEDLLSADSVLAQMRAVMTEDTCKDVEIIGWLYQFYISEKKDEVFAGLKKNKKVTPENIPAATQLFTPHWIVRYLVENSLGRLWMLNRPDSRLIERMDYYIKRETPEEDYLRISIPEEIKLCDPACGSGHMLTYAFDLLYAIYEEEGYDASDIAGKILTNNLFGIEIDPRAGALAAFALIMKARAVQRRFFRGMVQPNICVLANIDIEDSELSDYISVIGRDLFTTPLLDTLKQFSEMDNFGSLIRPKLTSAASIRERIVGKDIGSNLFLRDIHERVLAVLRMANYLAPKYHVVVANPPYMGSKGMNGRLSDWVKGAYPDSKSDLMTCFMERASDFAMTNGFWGMINLPSWMFLSSFEKLRIRLLSGRTIINLIQLGRGIFGSDFGTVAFVMQNSVPNSRTMGVYRRLFEKHVQVRNPKEIKKKFLDSQYGRFIIRQTELGKIPGSPLAYWVSDKMRSIFSDGSSLEEIAPVRQGFQTGDNDRYLRQWFEVSIAKVGFNFSSTEAFHSSSHSFAPYNKGGEFRRWYGNNEYVVKFDERSYKELSKIGNNLPSRNLYFNNSITWTSLSSGNFGARFNGIGYTFSAKGACAFPKDDSSCGIALALLNSKISTKLLQFLSPTLDFNVGSIRQIPIPHDTIEINKDKIVNNCEALINLARADWDTSEMSWDFTVPSLNVATHQGLIGEAYERLRTNWKHATEKVKQLEEQSNQILIEAYDLQEELDAEVPLEEITLSCNPAYRYGGKRSEAELEELLLADTVREFISYAVGCMFGRYSLDKPGVILANQGDSIKEYMEQVSEPTFPADKDNVIPMLDGDWFADDITQRFRKFLRVSFGDAKFSENLRFIEDAIGKDIQKYFLRDFYNDHIKRYKKRPIYWLFSSPKGSFNALIYMHRYRPDAASVVLNDYLREYRNKLEAERKKFEAISISSDASQIEKTKALREIIDLGKVIEELDEYEREILFPLATQKIEIDLDDGVKANYPKFGAALKPIKGLADAEE